MRIIFVTATFIFLMFSATVAWYSLTPIFYNVTETFNTTAFNMSLPAGATTQINRSITILQYLYPILMGMIILGIVVWLFVQTQRVDYESAEYY